ncbi:hypothetical protein G3A39_42845 [Paraburkholderia aspalathi]|nr:hypothetical protein [Paraburkholderia aspalathi]
MDAARAAAETGLSARLHRSGEIEFLHSTNNDEKLDSADSPDNALERWMNENQSHRRA